MINFKIIDSNPQGGCSYYRSIGPFSKLKYLDDSISIECLSQVSWPVLADADIVMIQRPIIDNHIDSLKMIKDFGIKIWVDIDDCLHEIPPKHPFYENIQCHNMLHHLEQSLIMANVVTVSTQTLAGYYAKFNKNIIVISNAFNDYNYKFEKIKKTVDFINWRGSNTHYYDLLEYKQFILSIAEKYPRWSWSFIGDDTKHITDYLNNCFSKKETDLLKYNKYISELHPAISIVPLVFNKFNMAKSNCAWLEATYSGAAVLAPTMPEFEMPGITLYNKNNIQSFEYQLDKLIKNEKLRKENYEKSYEYIKNNLLLSIVNKKRLQIINSLIEK